MGIAEGIETALSAHLIFKMPVWAALSAGGIRDFPVITGITFLRILADHDAAGRSEPLAHASADTKRRASKWKFDTRLTPTNRLERLSL